MGLIIL